MSNDSFHCCACGTALAVLDTPYHRMAQVRELKRARKQIRQLEDENAALQQRLASGAAAMLTAGVHAFVCVRVCVLFYWLFLSKEEDAQLLIPVLCVVPLRHCMRVYMHKCMHVCLCLCVSVSR